MQTQGTTFTRVLNDDIDDTGIFEVPAGITSLDDFAFLECTNLISLVFPAGLTSIGPAAFGGCTGLTSLVLPDCITSIGEYAFSGCTGLTSLVLPAGLTSISHGTFRDCTGLTSLVLPAGLTSIGHGAFWGCTGLTSLVLPAGITSISHRTFRDCTGLTSLVLPAGLTSISSDAFQGCTGLERIFIRDADSDEIARIRNLLPPHLRNNPNFEIISLSPQGKSSRKTVEVDQTTLNDFKWPLTDDNVDDKDVEPGDKGLDKALISSIVREISDEITWLQFGRNPFKSPADPKVKALEKLIGLMKRPPDGITAVEAIINEWKKDKTVTDLISQKRGFFRGNHHTKMSQFIVSLQAKYGDKNLQLPDNQSLTKTV